MSVQQDKFKEIADAIRGKTNSTDKIKPSEFASKVNDVYEAGKENGMVQLIRENITEFNSDKLTTMRQYALYRNSDLTSFDAPNLTEIGKYGLSECTNLTSINIPNLISIGEQGVSKCKSLTSFDAPNVKKLGNGALRESGLEQINCPNLTELETYVFYGCTGLTTVNLPLVSTIGGYAFRGCDKLKSVSFPMLSSLGTYGFYADKMLEFADVGKVSSIQANTFYDNYSLTTLIIRTEALCSLANTNAFYRCYHILGTTHSTYNPTGAKDGYIYVPKALVDSYKTATNWVTYADQIRAIEDYPEITGG